MKIILFLTVLLALGCDKVVAPVKKDSHTADLEWVGTAQIEPEEGKVSILIVKDKVTGIRYLVVPGTGIHEMRSGLGHADPGQARMRGVLPQRGLRAEDIDFER